MKKSKRSWGYLGNFHLQKASFHYSDITLDYSNSKAQTFLCCRLKKILIAFIFYMCLSHFSNVSLSVLSTVYSTSDKK